MEKTKWAALSGLVCTTILLSRNAGSSFAFDKPYHTSIVLLASGGVATLALSRLLSGDGRSTKSSHYDAVPLEDIGQPHASRAPSPDGTDARYPSSLRKLRTLFAVLVVALCLRVETLRLVLNDVQCATTTYAPLIPLAFALWDYLTVQRKRRYILEEEDDAGSGAYDMLQQNLTRTPYRYIICAGLVSFSSVLALRTTTNPASTHICATSLPYIHAVPSMQHIGTFLDILILYCITQLLGSDATTGARSLPLGFGSVGWAFLSSGVVMLVVGNMIYWLHRETRRWILSIPSMYIWSTVRFDLMFCCTLLCFLLSIHHTGPTTTTLITTFTSISTVTLSFAWANSHPFPPVSYGTGFLAALLLTIAFLAYFYADTGSVERSKSTTKPTFKDVPTWLYLVLLALLITRTCLWMYRTTSVAYHPIDLLMYEAGISHETYLNESSDSTTLKQAVMNYRNRYVQHPPPGFDRWYEYATARDSAIIDRFDSIHNDLMPFYALSPEQIRQRTWKLVSNPWNDVAGLSVRDGKIEISPNVVPTHRWMLDGIVEMIGKFAKHLPDMDLAFNLNDECRVAAPFEAAEPMRQVGRDFGRNQNIQASSFSAGRAEQWPPIPEEPIDERPLREISWQRTFYETGNVACPPSSPARTERKWDTARLCTSCSGPHSLGAYLANWTLAGNVCHQPDLANLHGVFLSPAAFKATNELYPIFSQSKTYGFNDILYPSAWNYMDKAKYDPSPEHPDPPFAQKKNSVFWRGATSEGVSPGSVTSGGAWKGMTRQRFVHLANNMNATAFAQPILLQNPPTNTTNKYTYTTLPISTLAQTINTDVHIVESIARCGGRDCPDQAAEFAPLVQPTDFQDHWRYAYLLDLDGAGFSGRFLPFLRSNSLPFKAAVFREWWDDRLTPWLHFVPLDVRGHGFWATLAYFAGLKGEVAGVQWDVEGHGAEAERIATRGKEWAEVALRKEDAEIYFFRLLLEWGRLTDDRRDELGFEVG
ncbi:hypothetical protein MBLNU230_g4722t1 [Neophaeotheca triangularis]